MVISVTVLGRNRSLKVQGKIGHGCCAFLLDTGASRSIIRPDYIGDQEITEANSYTLKTASGELIPVLGQVKLNFEIQTQPFCHEFLIANVTDECILGLDFMQAFGLSLNMVNGTLQYANMEIPLLEEDKGYGQARRILLVEDTTIPAQSECILWGKVEGHCKTISTKLVETARGTENSLAVGKTLVVSVGDRKVPVRVMNLYSQENKLRAGSVIADCYPVDLITQCRDAEGSTNTVAKESAQIHKILTKMEENLSMEEYNKAEKLILEFMDIMPCDEDDCGRTNLVQHRIDTGSARPIRQPPRRLPLAKQQEAIDMLERMKQQGVIEPSNSPWCSPVVLVKKERWDFTVLC
ncbi:uncharacterized protein LOC129924905 [Biomphalaria glabrata]|uniref:Uncharacterized protein LOC129924905 n=1 Tax=Biomphalaria glabrata TaxID=6526 RepID=A0A9W2ZTG2_BIOGL|nr:uncharacterized protein LOC129924905 [Biomphalaria glabrata]